MTKTLIVPTDGAWNEAPTTMPEEGQWCLVLVNHDLQIGCIPPRFKSWALMTAEPTTHNKKVNTVRYKSFASLEDVVFWSALPQIDELLYEVDNSES